MDEIAAIRAFIAARLAEEEADARTADQANPGKWRTEAALVSDVWIDIRCDNGLVAADRDEGGGVEPAAARHIAGQDPTVTLARVVALRALSDSCGLLLVKPAPGAGWEQIEGMRDYADVAIRHVAAIWPTHPDYRAEWAP